MTSQCVVEECPKVPNVLQYSTVHVNTLGISIGRFDLPLLLATVQAIPESNFQAYSNDFENK